ncbi:MAG: hypothetical protein HKO59_02605 [Phycisphaerales bacterium]|nr:hypothetical protein [Phycisphaerales bacterium]
MQPSMLCVWGLTIVTAVATLPASGQTTAPTAPPTPAPPATTRPAAISPEGIVPDTPGPTPPPTTAPGPPGSQLTVGRLVAHFDFEEAETALVEFPSRFRRIVAEDRGFPPFGAIGLTSETASEGRWSLHFALDGGSLAAETPTGVLPVLPLADYIVTAAVRTAGLTEARARLTATLFDADGTAIPGSRVATPPLDTGGVWQEVTVNVRGESVDAADLVVELELLQPTQYASNPVATRRPRPEDVSGEAWFDDISIWHVPRIELTTTSESNVVIAPDQPRLRTLVRDLAGVPLTAALRVRSMDGALVFEDVFPAPRGRHAREIELPLSSHGWFHAELALEDDAGPAGFARLDFLFLAELPRGRRPDAGRLGVLVPHTPTHHLEGIPPLVHELAVSTAMIDVWNTDGVDDDEGERIATMRRTLEALLADDVEVAFAIDSIPRNVAQREGVDPDQVLELLTTRPNVWLDELAPLLSNFGLRVQRWQFGRLTAPNAFWKPNLRALVGQAERALADSTPDPHVVIPFAADQELPAPPPEHVSILVPHQVTPAALPDYAAAWLQSRPDPLVALEPLPATQYGPRTRVVDLMHRGLYGWRAGIKRLSVPAPWRWAPGRAAARLDETFVAWRSLASSLSGRRYAGELRLGAGTRGWMLEGDEPGDDALVVWREQRQGESPTPITLVLADGPVRVIDPAGNEQVVTPGASGHTLAVDDLPRFVEGIDLDLAKFRAAFAIDPPFITALHRVHDCELVLGNPWSTTITGALRLVETGECRIRPRRHTFAIPPNSEVRLPLSIIVERSTVTGVKTIVADVDVTTDRPYRVRLTTEIEIGWRDVDFTAAWSLDGTRLRLTQYITNRSTEPINLDAFVLAPGAPHERQVVAGLPPGTTATRTFDLGTAATLAGRTIRVGVAGRGGGARLNQLLEIPASLDAVAGVADE